MVGVVVAVGLAGAGGILRFALDLKDMWRKHDREGQGLANRTAGWAEDEATARQQPWTYYPPSSSK